MPLSAPIQKHTVTDSEVQAFDLMLLMKRC